MSKPTDIGKNRTGADMAPDRTRQLEEGAAAVSQVSLDLGALQAERTYYSRNAPPLGTLPPPSSVRGKAKATAGHLTGKNMEVFVDMLGERLAFERTGVRLYDALMVKHAAADTHEGGPSRGDLQHIRSEEQAHLFMLIEAMEGLGCDPSAVTPSADVGGVAGAGLLQVIADPRVTLTEALKAILIAELADNDGWRELSDLANQLGQVKLAEKFQGAEREEREHLEMVRGWIRTAIVAQAGLQDEMPQAQRGDGQPTERDQRH